MSEGLMNSLGSEEDTSDTVCAGLHARPEAADESRTPDGRVLPQEKHRNPGCAALPQLPFNSPGAVVEVFCVPTSSLFLALCSITRTWRGDKALGVLDFEEGICPLVQTEEQVPAVEGYCQGASSHCPLCSL